MLTYYYLIMSEKLITHPILSMYEGCVKLNQEKCDYLGNLRPLIDPRIELPDNFPNIAGYVQRLGIQPFSINHDLPYMQLNYDNGNIYYNFDIDDFCYYLKSITVMDPKQCNKIETQITCDLLKDKEIPIDGIDWDTHYLINENRVLRVNLPYSNTPPYLDKE